MKNKKSYFITFEGGENSGKTTQSKMLYEYLLSKSIKAIHTREPGGTPVAEKIRDIFTGDIIHKDTELLLISAARNEHMLNVIIPAIKNKYWVICDRFIDSTTCYQGWGVYTRDLERFIHPDIMPEITFFMDIKPEICMLRSKNKNEINKFDNRDLDFHKEIYLRYKAIQDSYPTRIKSIECENLSIDEIHDKIINHPDLLKLLNA